MFNSLFMYDVSAKDYVFSNIPVSYLDVVWAVVIALIITFVARILVFTLRLLQSVSKLDIVVSPDKEKIKQDFGKLFPLTSFSFQGVTYEQGMRLRLVTKNNKIVEGELVGYNNNDGIICIVTERVVLAQKLSEMREINLIDK